MHKAKKKMRKKHMKNAYRRRDLTKKYDEYITEKETGR